MRARSGADRSRGSSRRALDWRSSDGRRRSCCWRSSSPIPSPRAWSSRYDARSGCPAVVGWIISRHSRTTESSACSVEKCLFIYTASPPSQAGVRPLAGASAQRHLKGKALTRGFIRLPFIIPTVRRPSRGSGCSTDVRVINWTLFRRASSPGGSNWMGDPTHRMISSDDRQNRTRRQFYPFSLLAGLPDINPERQGGAAIDGREAGSASCKSHGR